jgi:hypothetical protein
MISVVVELVLVIPHLKSNKDAIRPPLIDKYKLIIIFIYLHL